LRAPACCNRLQRMGKPDVYSWRPSPQLKAELEEAAQAKRKSVAQLLEEIAREWLERFSERGGNDHERQRRIRETALKSVGAIHGNDPRRAERSHSGLRTRISLQHAP